MCQDFSTSNQDHKLHSEKSSNNNQRPKTCLCPDCGVVVTLAATGVKQKRCAQCKAESLRARSRLAREKIRREKKIAPVKNTQIKCVDCSSIFTRKVIHSIRCKQCQYAYALAKAREASKSKPRSIRIGDQLSCKHCSNKYTVKSSRNFYCDACQVLSKKRQLPDAKVKTKKYVEKYFSNPKNKKKAREAQNAWKRNKVKQDPVFCLVQRVRARLGEVMRKSRFPKTGNTQEIIGCTWEQLAKHIERQFTKEMTWENRHLWHLDHIIPLSSAKTKDDVLRLNHFTNLRPLLSEDNLKKGNKVLNLL